MNCRTVALSFAMLTLVLTVEAAPPGVFNPTDTPMTSPRSLHTATLLFDGRVLIVGGIGEIPSTGNVITAETFDPLDRTFTALASLPIAARAFHTATLLADGTILITGGDSRGGGGSQFSSAEIFDPSANSFTATDSMKRVRSGHTATRLLNGTVLITGGRVGNAILPSAEIFDPATETFTLTTGPMAQARHRHAAVLLADGTVLLAGGQGVTFGALATAEIFDPTTKTFTPTMEPMTRLRGASLTATRLHDDEVLIVGGRNPFAPSVNDPFSDLYDPVTKTFRRTSNPQLGPINFHTATLVIDGTVLITGGRVAQGPTVRATIYHPTTETFSSTLPMADEREFHAATPLADDTVLITGGFGHTTNMRIIQSGAELFRP